MRLTFEIREHAQAEIARVQLRVKAERVTASKALAIPCTSCRTSIQTRTRTPIQAVVSVAESRNVCVAVQAQRKRDML